MSATLQIERAARRDETLMVPRPVPNQPGLVTVDATWGTISPIQIAPGVLTVGELEVIEHVGAGLAVVDTRLAHFYQAGTIPSAGNVPHEQIGESIGSARPGSGNDLLLQRPAVRRHTRRHPHAAHTRLSGGVDPLLPWGHPRLDDAGTAHPNAARMSLPTESGPAIARPRTRV